MNQRGPTTIREVRVNERIRAREVLVIDEDGTRIGVMPLPRALELARERDADLVEVAPNATPPVCRIMDYGKFKYEQSKKEREARKHQKQIVLREVRMKPKIDQHDLDFKARTAEKLLLEGDKVKVSVMFRGREITHPQIGRDLLDRVFEKVKHVGTIERPPTLEGRFMTMILSPLPSKPQRESQERETRRPAEERVVEGS